MRGLIEMRECLEKAYEEKDKITIHTLGGKEIEGFVGESVKDTLVLHTGISMSGFIRIPLSNIDFIEGQRK